MNDDSKYPDWQSIADDPDPMVVRSGADASAIRINPRYLFIDPTSSFGKTFYSDLLMEQQEQM